ncbi:MAG: hypothetical protein REI11_11580 [Patulibacter sp.]|nr:hypothetical protein [Patulibacter sp.]
MTELRISQADVEIRRVPGYQPPLRIRFTGEPGGKLSEAIAALVRFSDSSTPVDERRALRAARRFRLIVETLDGSADYIVCPPTGYAAPALRPLVDLEFGLAPAPVHP